LDKVCFVANWAESYLEVYEDLYGPIVLYPDMSVEEVNMEWVQSFRK